LLRKMTITGHPVTPPQDLTVIFASVPGDQHTLGIRMAADLFRNDGWEIVLKIGLSQDELIADIRKRPRCIVGLSIGGQGHRPRLWWRGRAIRAHARPSQL
jgi:methanogenic corrinoid protein MtbC1